MCDFHLNFSSMSTPKNLNSDTLSIVIPFRIKQTLSKHFWFVNNINLVLLKFNDNLFLLNHFWSRTNSCSIVLIKIFKFFPDTKKFVSSAKRTKRKIFDSSQRSLMYKINNLGPNTEPWGTPHCIVSNLDSWPKYSTYCCLFPNN